MKKKMHFLHLKFRRASFLALICLLPGLVQADELPAPSNPDGARNCQVIFGNLLGRSASNKSALERIAIEQDLERLESIQIKDLFKESLVIKGGAKKGVIAKITNAEISNFKIEFDHLVDQQAKLDPDFKKELYGFREWLLKKPGSKGAYPELDKVEIEAYRTDGRTLNDFVSDKYVEYQKSIKSTEGFLQWARGLGSRSLRHNVKSLVRSGFIRSKGFIGTFLGTTAAISMNSYINAGFEPIKKYFGLDNESIKENVNDLTDILKQLFDSFEGGKEKYNETVGLIEKLVATERSTNLNSMDRDRARLFVKEREQALANQFSKFAKSLDIADKDRHTRQKDFLRSLIPGMQISEANFNTQKLELRTLEDSIKNRGTPPTAQEASDVTAMRESMKESEADLARALAMWQAYKFTLGKNEQDKIRDLDVQFSPIYLNYVRFKDLTVYRNELLLLADETVKKLKEYNQ